jgi:hypothetical protein
MKKIIRSLLLVMSTMFMIPLQKAEPSVQGNSEMVTASVSTVAWREDGLKRVVADILPQVDKLNIFLQGYKSIPEFLQHPKITVVMGDDQPGALALGSSAKFFWADKIKGYHFTIDDDIFYPENYVKYCIEKIEQYHRTAIVGFHGTLLKDDVQNYVPNKKKFRFRKSLFNFRCALENDRSVHLLGTGVLAYHTDTIKISINDFLTRNMDDIYFGIAAQLQHVPLVCIQRHEDYLKPIELLATAPTSIYEQARQDGGKDILAVIQKFGSWQLYESK